MRLDRILFKKGRKGMQNMPPRTKTKTCVHHWIIEPANGPECKGSCKYCGEERNFINLVMVTPHLPREGFTVPGRQSKGPNKWDRRLKYTNLPGYTGGRPRVFQGRAHMKY